MVDVVSTNLKKQPQIIWITCPKYRNTNLNHVWLKFSVVLSEFGPNFDPKILLTTTSHHSVFVQWPFHSSITRWSSNTSAGTLELLGSFEASGFPASGFPNQQRKGWTLTWHAMKYWLVNNRDTVTCFMPYEIIYTLGFQPPLNQWVLI